MTKEQKQEFTRRISQANKSVMIVILYDIFLAYIQDALDMREDSKMYHTSIRKAKDAIGQLLNSINPDNPLAGNYISLYGFILRQLARADSSKDQDILRQLQSMVASLRNTFEQVSQKDTSPAIMGNVETVYAGLTYGRDQLNENLENTDNRGFLV
jgi:flagellar protein FliS